MTEKKLDPFLTCLIAILIYPLIPIFVELVITKRCLDTTLTLTAAVYSITVLTSSNRVWLVYFSFLPGLLLTSVYVNLLTPNVSLSTGKLIPREPHTWPIISITVLSIIGIAIFHASERYRRHVIENEKFLPYYK